MAKFPVDASIDRVIKALEIMGGLPHGVRGESHFHGARQP